MNTQTVSQVVAFGFKNAVTDELVAPPDVSIGALKAFYTERDTHDGDFIQIQKSLKTVYCNEPT
jgi:hypothetical protein